MRKLLLCDLDTVLLYSKKLVKKCPPFHSWKLLTGVLRINFLMEIVKVLSICSTNKLFTRWESFCFATLIQSCSIVNSWLTNAPLSFMKTSNRGTENAFFNGNVEEVLSICSTNNSTGSQLYLSLITEHTRYVSGENRNSTTLDKLLHGMTKTSLSRTETEEEWVKSPPALLFPLPHRHQGENAGWTILAI